MPSESLSGHGARRPISAPRVVHRAARIERQALSVVGQALIQRAERHPGLAVIVMSSGSYATIRFMRASENPDSRARGGFRQACERRRTARANPVAFAFADKFDGYLRRCRAVRRLSCAARHFVMRRRIRPRRSCAPDARGCVLNHSCAVRLWQAKLKIHHSGAWRRGVVNFDAAAGHAGSLCQDWTRPLGSKTRRNSLITISLRARTTAASRAVSPPRYRVRR